MVLNKLFYFLFVWVCFCFVQLQAIFLLLGVLVCCSKIFFMHGLSTAFKGSDLQLNIATPVTIFYCGFSFLGNLLML